MLGLPSARRYTLTSRLSPEQCERRLRRRLVTWRRLSDWLPFGRLPEDRPIRGTVTRRGFAIRKYVRYGNGMQTVARGTFVQTGSGTRVDVAVGMGPEALVCWVLWFCAVFAFSVAFVALSIGTNVRPMVVAQGLLYSAALCIVGAAVFTLGRWLARGEGVFLLELLKATLEAHDEADHLEE